MEICETLDNTTNLERFNILSGSEIVEYIFTVEKISIPDLSVLERMKQSTAS